MDMESLLSAAQPFKDAPSRKSLHDWPDGGTYLDFAKKKKKALFPPFLSSCFPHFRFLFSFFIFFSFPNI